MELPSREHPCLVPIVSGKSSQSMATLTRTKSLLKMNECMNFYHWFVFQLLPFSQATAQNQAVLLYLYPRFHGLPFIFESHLFQNPSKSISLLCNTHLRAIPLSLYFCLSMQHSSHMVLFISLALSHPWKVAFKLQHRKPNYTRSIHTHAHTHPAVVMSQIDLCCTLTTPKASAATISTCPSPQ